MEGEEYQVSETCPIVPEGASVDRSLESTLVDRALDNVLSLPGVVSEVTKRHQDQMIELRAQQEELRELQNYLSTVQEKLDKVSREVSQINTCMLLTQEDVNRTKSSCKEIEQGMLSTNEYFISYLTYIYMDVLIRRNIELERLVVKIEQELGKEQNRFSEISGKMKVHMDKVHQVESTLPAHESVTVQLAKIDHLKSAGKKLNQTAGSSENTGDNIEKIITSLREEDELVSSKIKSAEDQLKIEQDKQRQVKQDIEICQRRNAAKLTRLKRQLREAQSDNRHWNEQATRLEECITDLRQKLQE